MTLVNIPSDFGNQKNPKSVTGSIISSLYLPGSDGTRYQDLSCFFFFLMLHFKPVFSTLSFHPMPCRATQDGLVTVKSSDKMWATGEENGNPLQYSCHENSMDNMKREEGILAPKDEGKEVMVLTT